LLEEEESTTVLQAIVLGIVQGVTEFAPVSSSGHLILVPWLFGWTFVAANPELNKTFDVALHLGTFAGALVYFWSDIVAYVKAWVESLRRRQIRGTDERLAWLLILGTIPGIIAGVAFENVIEDKLGQPWLIAVALAVGGIVLYLVDRYASTERTLPDLGVRDSVTIGIAQALALQPGVSRSGITITTGRALGIGRESAARFSFLLSLPIIFGAGVYKGVKLVGTGLPPGMAAPFLWGMAAAAVSGFLTIWWMLGYLRRRDFAIFVVYRLAVAAFIFVLIATGARPATI
jgi:undecaprenyl-diphosphatase